MKYTVTILLSFYSTYFAFASRPEPDVPKVFNELKRCVALNNIKQFIQILENSPDENFRHYLYGLFLKAANENAEYKDENILKYFVDYWHNYRSIPLDKKYAMESFDQLYEKWSNEEEIDVPNSNGDLPIHIISRHKETSLLRLYIDAKRNLDAMNFKHETALLIAIALDNEKHVKLLVYAGADVMLRDPWARSPLYFGITSRKISIIHILCERLTVDGMAYAWASALMSDDYDIIKSVLDGINDTLVQYKINALLLNNQDLRRHIFHQKRVEKSAHPGDTEKFTDLDYIIHFKYYHEEFLRWGIHVWGFITIWHRLLKRVFIDQKSVIIKVPQDDDSLANIEVCTIDELYRLITQRRTIPTTDGADRSEPSGLDINVGMITGILEQTSTIHKYNFHRLSGSHIFEVKRIYNVDQNNLICEIVHRKFSRQTIAKLSRENCLAKKASKKSSGTHSENSAAPDDDLARRRQGKKSVTWAHVTMGQSHSGWNSAAAQPSVRVLADSDNERLYHRISDAGHAPLQGTLAGGYTSLQATTASGYSSSASQHHPQQILNRGLAASFSASRSAGESKSNDNARRHRRDQWRPASHSVGSWV